MLAKNHLHLKSGEEIFHAKSTRQTIMSATDAAQVLQDELVAAGDAFQEEEAQNATQTTGSGDVQSDAHTDTQTSNALSNTQTHTDATEPFVPAPAPFDEPSVPSHAASNVSSTQDPNSQQMPQQEQILQTRYPPNIGPRRLGIVTSYHARKGWGFIRDMYTGDVFFTHHTEVVPYWPNDRIGSDSVQNFKNCLHTGEYVEFGVGENPSTGEICAKHVTGICGYTLQMDWATIRYIQTRNARTGEISPATRPQPRDGRSFSRGGQSREYGSTTIQQRPRQPLQQRRRTQERAASSTTQTPTGAPTSSTQSVGQGTSTVPTGWE